MKPLIAAAILGLAAIILADAFGLTLTRAAAQPGITIDIERLELRCDGDATRITVHARDASGAPIKYADVALVVTGTVSKHGHQFASGEVAGKTDRNGDFTARVTPTPGTHVRWDIYAKVGDAISYPLAAACAFSGDRAYVLGGTVFTDSDGDGVRDARERDARGVTMTITSGYSFGSWVPPHSQRTGRDGSFEWAGLSQDPVSGRSPWHVCLADDRLVFTSRGGAPIAPASCVDLELVPGMNTLALGVGRAR